MAVVMQSPTTTVSDAEMDAKCMRCVDQETNEVFYRVASESDPLSDGYSVRTFKRNGKWFYSCTCKAGQDGFAHCRDGQCKHVRWSKVAARLYKEATQGLTVTASGVVASTDLLYFSFSDGNTAIRYLNGTTTCGCIDFHDEHRCKHTDAASAHLRAGLVAKAVELHDVVRRQSPLGNNKSFSLMR